MSRRLILLLAVAVALFTLAPAVGAGNANGNFTASLKGRNEAPAVDTKAAGQAIVKLRNGDATFKLIVANIENAVAAHIHCDGPRGVNGPVSVPLFSGGPTSENGILAQGEITFTGACGINSVADLVAEIERGEAYVNVHTTAHPGGEIRGQLS